VRQFGESHVSVSRYLAVTGNAPRWVRFAWIAFFIWVVGVRIAGEIPQVSEFLFVLLCPLAAGTGLLTTARRRGLDLLIGTGVSRGAIWWSGVRSAVLEPTLMALVLVAASGPRDPATALVRLAGVLIFTGGVCFLAGLIEPRQTAGVLWLLARFVFVLAPAGMSTFLRYAKHVETPSTASYLLIAAAAPESMTESVMPGALLVVCSLIGVGCMAWSYRRFVRADFCGEGT
jgi:hypothetical protein